MSTVKLPIESVRIGTRGSDLALWQANWVKDQLRRHWGPALQVELEIVTTEGDLIQDRMLHQVGGKGLFVRGIEDRLLQGTVDLAVHSMKDLPAEMPAGLVIACTPRREDPRDALVGPEGARLVKLAPGTRVGTGSLRRTALIRRLNPGVQIVPIRGNVPTRLAKVDQGEVDAVILAQAGLVRLGLADRTTELLELDRFCPAPCQGILALQCRSEDRRIHELLSPLSDTMTAAAAAAERAFLRALQGGCTVPIGCYAEVRAEDVMTVSGLVCDPSGRPCFMATKVGRPEAAGRIGLDLANTLLKLGAGRVIESLAQRGAEVEVA